MRVLRHTFSLAFARKQFTKRRLSCGFGGDQPIIPAEPFNDAGSQFSERDCAPVSSTLPMKAIMLMRDNNVLLPMALPTQSPCARPLPISSAIFSAMHTKQTSARQTVLASLLARCAMPAMKRPTLTHQQSRGSALSGPRYLDPYNRLYGATATPIRPIAKDPLSDMAHAVAVICDMRRHDGDGGSTETPKEQLDALPALKEARASLTVYIASIERLRAVADPPFISRCLPASPCGVYQVGCGMNAQTRYDQLSRSVDDPQFVLRAVQIKFPGWKPKAPANPMRF